MKSVRQERERKRARKTNRAERWFSLFWRGRRMEAPSGMDMDTWLRGGGRGRDRCTKLLPISMLMERGISSGQEGGGGGRAARNAARRSPGGHLKVNCYVCGWPRDLRPLEPPWIIRLAQKEIRSLYQRRSFSLGWPNHHQPLPSRTSSASTLSKIRVASTSIRTARGTDLIVALRIICAGDCSKCNPHVALRGLVYLFIYLFIHPLVITHWYAKIFYFLHLRWQLSLPR